jgi:hypothetical protein
VVSHVGVLAILFFASVPNDITTSDYISEFWHTPEGGNLIILNVGLLLANLIFALSIIYLASNSYTVLVVMTLIAWLGVLAAYYIEAVGLVAYTAGAIHLTASCQFQRRQNRVDMQQRNQI